MGPGCAPSAGSNPNGILDPKYRATAHLPRFLRETGYRYPPPANTAFSAVYGTPLRFYAYLNEHDQDALANFALSIEEWGRNQLTFFEHTYPLEDRVKPSSLFVDVAGGYGYLGIFLAKKLPSATFLVQDLPSIAEQGRKSLSSDLQQRVSFQTHDIFTPQPKLERANGTTLVYLLKIILHEYTDAESHQIINQLLANMETGDKILIVDTVISEVGGSLSSCFSDLIVLSLIGGTRHRTLKEWIACIKGCDDGDALGIETFQGGAKEADGLMVVEITKTT